MKALFILLLVSLPLLRAETVRRAEDGRLLDLTWEMSIQQAELTKDGLRIVATKQMDKSEVGLEIHVPAKRTMKERETSGGLSAYRFPVHLRPLEASAPAFDRLIATHFGQKPNMTIFRDHGYAGAAAQKPEDFSKKGGTLFLSDPVGAKDSLLWSITIKIDIENRKLTLTVGETRYG